MRQGWLILLLLPWYGCSSQPERFESTSLPNTGKPTLHAVHERRLDGLMRQMNSLMFDNLRTELELDRERRKHALKIAEEASALSKAVDQITDTLPNLNLSPEEQTLFLSLAKKLHDQAAVLKHQAQSNHIDAMPATLGQMSKTCTSCHQLFRELGG